MTLIKDHSFPTFQLFVLALCRIAEPIALTSIFPYAYPMVKGFLGEDNPNNALYTGILISSFSMSEALTGVLWGSVSDRVGRKPVLLLGLLGTTVSLLMTGFAKSFSFALFARVLGGLLNGNMGVIQTMVGELVKNPDHEPRAFAVMPFVWCIGSIIGPAIAGLTSNSTIFPEFPYLMPNLIGAGLLITGILMGFFFLEETLDAHDRAVAEEKPLLSKPIGEQNAEADERTESYGTFNWVNLDQTDSRVASPSDSPRLMATEEREEKIYSKKVLLLVSALCLYCYHAMAYDHLLPVFLQDERAEESLNIGQNIFDLSGGLGLSTYDVGTIMSINGLIALAIQGILFPIMTDVLGIWHTFILVTIMHPIAYFIMPYITLLPQSLTFTGVYSALLIRNIFYIPAYPIILILIKEAANPKHLGRVNGLAASAGAIARMLGPPVAGLLYGIGTRVGFTGLAWWGTGAVAILGAIQAAWIKRAKNAQSTISTPFIASGDSEMDCGGHDNGHGQTAEV